MKLRTRRSLSLAFIFLWALLAHPAAGQAPAHKAAAKPAAPALAPARPKLVVLLVVDQMRADYVDRFEGQWNGGMKRLLGEGAWFREAAYPYAATETCVGHATISTGALPAMHGMVANAWWDRDSQKMVTCTADPNVKNIGYGGGGAKFISGLVSTTSSPQGLQVQTLRNPEIRGGDSAWRMRVPAFAEELRFQS